MSKPSAGAALAAAITAPTETAVAAANNELPDDIKTIIQKGGNRIRAAYVALATAVLLGNASNRSYVLSDALGAMMGYPNHRRNMEVHVNTTSLRKKLDNTLGALRADSGALAGRFKTTTGETADEAAFG